MLQILGDPGDNYTLDIQKGFEEVMAKEAPEVEIISKPAMLWEPTNAGKVFEDQILVNPDIDLVFAHSGHLTVPIVSIMEAKGLKPGDILMLASSGMPVALDHIRQGWQQAEVEQPTFAQVYGIAMFLPMILKGEKPQPGTYKVLGLDAVLTDEEWGPLTGLNLPALRVSVGEMAAALERVSPDAAKLLDWKEDPAIAKLVNSWPGNVHSKRAAALGLSANKDFESIIREYIRENPQAIKVAVR